MLPRGSLGVRQTCLRTPHVERQTFAQQSSRQDFLNFPRRILGKEMCHRRLLGEVIDGRAVVRVSRQLRALSARRDKTSAAHYLTVSSSLYK